MCGTHLPSPFLSLGEMPLANNLPESPDESEDRYPLELVVCPNCFLVQLGHVVDPHVLFTHYLYSSTSGLLSDHFQEMAAHLAQVLGLDSSSLVVDIGSNDGLLLSCFKMEGISNVRGVEPAANLASEANRNLIPTLNAFFSNDAVGRILATDGAADLVTATNVFAHVDDIKALLENVKLLLKPDGVLVIEVPYLPEMLKTGTFDLVYHEHLSYLSVTPLVTFFPNMGMEIFRIETIPTHGGSLRVLVQMAGGKHAKDGSVDAYLSQEETLRDPQTYADFGRNVREVVESFANQVRELKGKRHTLAGYAAPAKASTLLGYTHIDHRFLDYIVDDNPMKQGRYVPGTSIPIVSSSMLDERPPDYLVILAWNLADVIIGKLGQHKAQGMKFIVPFS